MLLIGADPEVFVKQNNEFISGYGLIPGTKNLPFNVDMGAVQVDGMALEFNISPAKNKEEFVYNISSVYTTLKSLIPENLSLEISATADFDTTYMLSLPEKATELGCDPDYNAYSGNVNPRPHSHPTMRTAAGHVHLGWTEEKDIYDYSHYLSCCALVKQLDFYLGLPSLFLDEDVRRRELYGKAGAFRPKPYGVEYRVLSNFWLKSPSLMEWVYENTQMAFHKLTVEGIMLSNSVQNVDEIINSNNKEMAFNICKQYDIKLGA